MKFASVLTLLLVSKSVLVVAQPAPVTWTDCTSASTRSASNYDPNSRINVTNVFAQIAYPLGAKTLRMTLIGVTGAQIQPSLQDPDGSLILTTLITRTSVLTFNTNQTNSWFCDTARPPSPLPSLNPNGTSYCPLSPGQVAWSLDAPLKHDYNLTTIVTRIRVLDPSRPPRDLVCVDVYTTPVRRDNSKTRHLGYEQILFWLSTGLAILYWVVIGFARLSAAWGRGVARGPGWGSVRWAGAVFASAVSGERLSTHSPLLRFATPSWRDVIVHTQWCAALAMIAVEWPTFAYPILSNAAWATLSYNITLSSAADDQYAHWSPYSPNFSPPSNFADQISDVTSPLYLQSDLPNSLYLLPNNAKDGLSSFAAAVGVRPQDLFGICMKLWLIIVAGAIVISGTVWLLDWLVSSLMDGGHGFTSRGIRRRSTNDLNRFMDTHGTEGESGGAGNVSEHRLQGDEDGDSLPRDAPRALVPAKSRRWWNHRLGQSSFHGSVLQGNLLRLLLIFHFPITVFSTYEFSRGSDQGKASSTSLAMASLAFIFLSILIPVLLVARLRFTPTKKLFDATRTILALGPLYSHYARGAQLFAGVVLSHSLALGIIIGAGQRSGTAQAIIILVLEVAGALAASIWLPWGEHASMGIVSFLLCVSRIITMVLMIILSPVVSVGPAAGGWIAYAIIVLQGIVYVMFLLLIIVKIVEGLVRLFARVPFEKATHHLDGGLLGALSQAGWCGMRRKSKTRQITHNGKASSLGGRQTPHSTMTSYPRTPPSLNTAPMNYLRPEQVYQPYREDADDETGYIMGAWADGGGPTSSNTRPSYLPVSSGISDAASHPSTSGFSRVRGGRATYDDPFAALPVSAAGARNGHARQSSSTSTAPLPPGAMAAIPTSSSSPGHARVSSQIAQIEHAPGFPLTPPRPLGDGEEDGYASSTSSTAPKRKSAGFWPRRISSTPDARNSLDEDTISGARGSSKPPGKSWLGRFMNRSEGGGEGRPSTDGAGSSFVVVRDKKPFATSAPVRSEGVSGGDGEKEADDPSSFVVVRPKRSSAPLTDSERPSTS